MKNRTLINASVGAVVTIVLSFTIVMSPVLGGGVAGYLQPEDRVRVGAMSGIIASVLAATLGMLLYFSLQLGELLPSGIERSVIILVLLVAPGIIVALSILGGIIGGYVKRDIFRYRK